MTKSNEPQYPVEELLANAEALFQVKPEILKGALHGLAKAKLTIGEAQNLIDKFLKRKVIQ